MDTAGLSDEVKAPFGLPFDVFFLALGVVFALYSVDILTLVIASMIATQCDESVKIVRDEKNHKITHFDNVPKGGDDIPAATKSDSANSLQEMSGKDSKKWNEPKCDSAKSMHEEYPKVLIQIPMYNEEAMCDIIIDNCSKVKWPRDRVLIQVLDDSTKQAVRDKVDQAAVAAMENGIPVQVLRRTNRQGYKAGAMVEGLKYVEPDCFEYAAIFDADFEPPVDFLYQTIYKLKENNKLGFVQTCWTFSNINSFLTWAQSVNLNFHFQVEQRARSYMGWFFNFCGTAGVWRIKAIEDAGGWESDTVVEDMDLSLRAYLKGWNGLYLHHVKSPNELPPTLAAYKTQQFRWLSGPMQILIKCFQMIYKSKNVTFRRKISCYWFFFRYTIFALISFLVLAVPPYMFFVAQWHWSWEQIFFTVTINFALAVYLYVTPFSILFLLFSVAVQYFKTWAMMAGLIGSKKSKSWKVTKKFGAGTKKKFEFHKPYLLELILFVYYAACGAWSAWNTLWIMLAYCGIMSISFLVVAFGDYIL